MIRVLRRPAFQVAGALVLAMVLGNVGALADSLLHPEIPYFDEEHLIVGGMTALASAVLLLLLVRYARYLTSAVHTIHRLEALLPICAYCKKIRKQDTDPGARESWQPLESYITEKTKTAFSHGICPECMAALYPEAGSKADL